MRATNQFFNPRQTSIAPEPGEMLRLDLTVHELEAPAFDLSHELDASDLRRVGQMREHRLAEKRAPERDAVETADETKRIPRTAPNGPAAVRIT